MKAVLRIMMVIIIVFLIGFYSGPSVQENDVLENDIGDLPRKEENTNAPNEISNTVMRPKSGLSVFVGESVESFKAHWGEPDRVDPGHYELDWLIYNRGAEGYMQIAIKDSVVSAAFALGEDVDVSPFYIGQSIDEIYRFTIISSEIVVEDDNGVYQFELSEEDLHSRLLVPFGDIFAQLFIDQFTGTILGVHYMGKEALISQRPYELVYPGDLPQIPHIENQRAIDAANENQLFDMTNVIRMQRDVESLEWEEEVAQVARGHSKNMHEEEFFSNESPTEGTLADRLEETERSYQEVAENIATNYSHAPAVIHAWMNSPGHRKTLLQDGFTHLGIGVYNLYFTQDFIKQKQNNDRRETIEQNAPTH
ncbi:CAP domain-containing protein [Jeotgalibacillus marinus]|uniref:CAP domain-containing protein n=1 Tax=Jeotgalibacillus marinus TaxID=86667 RepID=A0ABV3Q259_9BACL